MIEDRKNTPTASTDVNFDYDSIYTPDDLEMTLKRVLSLDCDTPTKEDENVFEQSLNFPTQKGKGKGKKSGIHQGTVV